MKIIGITGGVGCGKSTVLKLIEENFNALVIMADDVAKELMEPGKPGYEQTVAFFGEDILERTDEAVRRIDRKLLSDIVFSNPNKRIVLNSIVHPLVKKEIVARITREKINGGYDFIFIEAALLLDDHYEVFCDEIWYIYADEKTRRARLKDARGYSDAKIDGIIASQLTEEEFRSRCTRIIDNSGGLAATYCSLVNLLQV